ncbi:hypothetical protein RAS1_22390 [Phycisphaerae bacterium RAS1]|nr:hypothetical protein RAS1_22390 [Phycisphaerae bacterium RAS1]
MSPAAGTARERLSARSARRPGPSRAARRFVALIAAVLLSPPQPSAAAQSLPASSGPTETLQASLQRLKKARSAELSETDRALLVGLEFCLAIDAADGKRAAGLLDPSGYQALPSEGALPPQPAKPLFPPALAELVSKRAAGHAVATSAANAVRVIRQKELREHFPAMADWMLASEDYALLVDSGLGTSSWLARDACLVIRVRGSRAYVMGGNLLEAIRP